MSYNIRIIDNTPRKRKRNVGELPKGTRFRLEGEWYMRTDEITKTGVCLADGVLCSNSNGIPEQILHPDATLQIGPEVRNERP